MPAPLYGFRVHLLRDQMMVAQRDPVALAHLAGGCARGGPCGGGSGGGGIDVLAEDWGEEFGEGALVVVDEGVGVEGVADGWRDAS